jgi:hypothetical protein
MAPSPLRVQMATRQLIPDALPNISEQSHGIFKPTTCGGDLSGITTVLVVAVLAPSRCATAVCATMPQPPAAAEFSAGSGRS